MNKIKVKIKDIAEVKNGSTPSTENQEFFDGKIIWVTPKDLSDQNKKYIFKGARTITEAGLNSCSSVLVPKGTILLSSRAPIGLLSIAGVELCTNQGFKNIVPDVKKINSEFLYYYFKIRIKEVESLGSGTTFKEVSKNSIENYEIEIPESVIDQQEIASVLSALDKKIEINNRINFELEAIAKTLYDYWFVQFDFPNENSKPYKFSGGEIVWSEALKRDIPYGWDVVRMDNMEPNIITGKTPPTEISEYFNGEIPFICIGDVRGGMHIVKTESMLSKKGADIQKNKYIPAGAICVTCIASPGLIGFATEESQTNQQLNSIVCDKIENRYYLYFYLKDYFKYSNAKTGNTFANMNKEDFSSILVLRPDVDLMIEFSKIIKPLIEKILINSTENKKLSELRDWLLPMLMNGQVIIN